MKLTIYSTLLFLLTTALFSGCEHSPLFDELDQMNKRNDSIPNVEQDPEKPCNPDSVYFENDIFPILQSNCAFSGCHGDGSAEDGVNLSNYKSIILTGKIKPFNPGGSDLYEVISEKDPEDVMPPLPANKLSADQIAKIAKWINQGALNNSCDGCDTSTVTYSNTIAPIIQNFCQGCHSGGSPNGNISLTNYSEIEAQAVKGKLYGTVNHAAGYVAMPYNQNKLSQCKIDQIRIWVENGAPND